MRTLRIRGVIAAAAAVVAVSAAAHAANPEPVALLVQMSGDVTVQRADAGATEAGVVGLPLNVGDRVVVANGGRAIVLYRTGRMQKADATVTIEAPPEGGEPAGLFAQTMRTLGQVATTDAKDQPNRQGMIRPIAGAPVPILPRNEIKVLDVRPTFTWFAVPGVDEYMIQLRRVAPDQGEPVRFRVRGDTTWTLPAAAAPLVPGSTYEWTVGGVGGGRVAEPQKFRVVSSMDLGRLEETFDDMARAGMNPDTEGLFLTALAYRDAGLFYEAKKALDRMEAEGVAAGRSYHMLRGEVYNALGELGRAEQAFARAEHPGS